MTTLNNFNKQTLQRKRINNIYSKKKGAGTGYKKHPDSFTNLMDGSNIFLLSLAVIL